jgi:hypothetical protein
MTSRVNCIAVVIPGGVALPSCDHRFRCKRSKPSAYSRVIVVDTDSLQMRHHGEMEITPLLHVALTPA